jgi:Skp family chaperone for outer membrane proteins
LEVEDGEIFSEVLGLGLAIEGRHLRFRNAGCNIPDSRDLAERATQMLKGHVERIGAMEGELESERQRADTERQRADTEQQRAETERQRAETERQRADAAEKALEALRARLGAEA